MDERLIARLKRAGRPWILGSKKEKQHSFFHEAEFQCADGWFGVLLQLGHRASLRLAQLPEDKRVYATEVKQKFGPLRLYTRGSDPEIKDLIDRAVEESLKTCFYCGAPGKLVNHRGALYVLCPTHERRITAGHPAWHENWPHPWEVETVGGGPVGDGDFWHCPKCDASGGSTLGGELVFSPFLAGQGYGNPTISLDCTEAERQIDEIKATPEWIRGAIDMNRRYGAEVLAFIEKTFKAPGKLAKRGLVYGGFPNREGRAFELEPQPKGWILRWTGAPEEHVKGLHRVLERLGEHYRKLVSE